MTARRSTAAAIAAEAVAMTARGAAIAGHLQRVSPRRFAQLVAQIELAFACVRDVVSGAYPHIPWKTVGALTAALAYFVAPFDAIPDVIPISGFIDDAAVFALVFGAVESDLRQYCDWRGVDGDGYFGDGGGSA